MGKIKKIRLQFKFSQQLNLGENMELVPILSAIILTATMATFIFSIAAYILYKIREAKDNRENIESPKMRKIEIHTPLEQDAILYQNSKGEIYPKTQKFKKLSEVENDESVSELEEETVSINAFKNNDSLSQSKNYYDKNIREIKWK